MKRICTSHLFLKNKISFFRLNINKFSSSLHVDEKDDKFFRKIKDWWDPNGSMYTLHYYNDLRIKYLKRELNKEGVVVSKDTHIENNGSPFSGIRFLDVGCGGGLLCESIARLGGKVVGIDSNENSYEIASGHLNTYEGKESEIMRERLGYFHGSIDNYKLDSQENKFDVITAMEVIEHVNSPRIFIEDLTPFVKKGGHLFISTINKTKASYYISILLGEKLTGIIPEGTHDWNKFLTPEELIIILNDNGYSVKNITGVSYNPLTSHMDLIDSTSVNYILIAKKN